MPPVDADFKTFLAFRVGAYTKLGAHSNKYSSFCTILGMISLNGNSAIVIRPEEIAFFLQEVAITIYVLHACMHTYIHTYYVM